MMLCGETRIKEQDSVFARYTLSEQQEQSESRLHGAYSGHNATSGNIDIEKCFQKVRGILLKRLDAGDVGILVGYTLKKCGMLCLYTYLRGR